MKEESLECSLELFVDPFSGAVLVRRLESEAFLSKLLQLLGKCRGFPVDRLKEELSKLVGSLWLVERESFLVSPEGVEGNIEKINLCRVSFRKEREFLEVKLKFRLKIGGRAAHLKAIFFTRKYLNGDSLFKEPDGDNEATFVERLIGRGERFTVFVVDIQEFSKFNDAYGLVNGDKILNDVLRRLKLRMEEKDCRVFKSYSDRFVVVCKGGRAEAGKLVREILSVFDFPFEVEGEQIYLSVNVGIAFFPEHGKSVISKAEIAQREALKRKRPFLVFSSSLGVPNRVLEVLTRVKEDLKNGRIDVHFQPKVELQTFKIVGAEALMRCSVSPAEAIPVIVEHGLMYDVGREVLKRAFVYARELEERGFRVPVSVNVSYVQLADRQFTRSVRRLLESYSLEGSRFIFEITESEASLDDGAIIETLSELRSMGIGISIDDFGMGYSSLSRLKLLKACELKIDRSFICEIDRDPEVLGIVKFAVDIASLLSMRTVAEGIERSEQVPILRRVGCNEGQGFLFSPPVEFERLVELLRKGYLKPGGLR